MNCELVDCELVDWFGFFDWFDWFGWFE